MAQYMARLVFANGRIEDKIFASPQRDVIELPGFDGKTVYNVRFVFDRELSDRDAIPTFVENDRGMNV